MPPSKATIISAYRDLYRSGLHAVQYSKPSRYVLKKTLDDAFREGSVSEFDALRIANTKLFLDNAAKSTGQEHKVVKNLLHVRWYEREVSMGRIPSMAHFPWNSKFRKSGTEQFNYILERLNESLQLCLR